MFFTTIFGSP